MERLATALLFVFLVLLVLCIHAALVEARSALIPLTVFIEPGVTEDSAWMADADGLFKAEGLDVTFRIFPSGTTAFEAFKAGAGDIIVSGDLPALQYWQRGGAYRVIAALERDSAGYIGVVSNNIKNAKDLVGKTIATRVGSTGSYFISEYLTKNGINEDLVKVRNLDPPLMPAALCRGNISGFFIWEPTPTRALQICGKKIHYLTTATGYIRGYSVIGARPDFLDRPRGRDATIRFLRAMLKGKAVAAADYPAVLAYVQQKFGMTVAEVKSQRAIMDRVLALDTTFFDDFCSENRWQERAGLQKGPSDLSKWVWEDGLKTINPALVVPAPPPC